MITSAFRFRMSAWLTISFALTVCPTFGEEPTAAGPEHTAPASPATAEARTVAVLDFEVVSPTTDESDWSIGLAEFLTAALQERGVVTLERRDLRYVLSERRLHTQGLVRQQDAIRSQLPWVRYLVLGQIRPRAGGRFELSVSLIDARHGPEVFRDIFEGKYPTDLAAGLIQLADKIAAWLGKAQQTPAATGGDRPGFARTPEVALQFYRGLDWMTRGHPELAEQYFHQAYATDPEFRVARLWRMRAFRLLGLNDFARLAVVDLGENRFAQSALQSLEDGAQASPAQTVLCFVPPPDTLDRDRRLEDELAHVLVQERDLKLIRPRTIKELADESDLSLTGEFEDRMGSDELLLAADLIIWVGLCRASPGDQPSIQMTLLDALTGEVRATGRRPYIPASSRFVCAELFRELLTQPDASRSGPQVGLPPQGVDNVPTRLISGLGVYGYLRAYHLRAFADDPHDPNKLMAFLDAIMLASPLQPDGLETAAIQRLLSRRLAEMIDEREADAANWLSQALWMQVIGGMPLLPNGLYRRVSRDFIEQTLQPLVSRFPTSQAAFYARYVIAIERAVAGRDREAAEVLETLVEQLPEFGDHDWPPDFKANLFFFAAREAYLASGREPALQFLEKAENEMQKRTPEARAQCKLRLFGVVHARYSSVRFEEARRVQPAADQTWMEDLGYWSNLDYRLLVVGLGYRPESRLDEAIADLHAKLLEAAREPTLHELFQETTRAAGYEGLASRWSYLQRLLAVVRRGEPLDDQNLYYSLNVVIRWLTDLMPKNRLPELRKLVQEIVDAFTAREEVYDFQVPQRFALYMAAAMYDEARDCLDSASSKAKDRDPVFVARAKARVVFETQSLAQAARVLDEELDRAERDSRTPGSPPPYYDAMTRAWAYQKSGQFQEAARAYQRGINVPMPHPVTEHSMQYKLSLIFELAKLKAQSGEKAEAAALFKQVIEECQDRDWGLLRGSYIINKLTLRQQAVERLELLRNERTALSPTHLGASAERLFDLANKRIAAGDLPMGVELLYCIIRRSKGARFNALAVPVEEVDLDLARRAEVLLEEQRLAPEE